MFKNHRFII